MDNGHERTPPPCGLVKFALRFKRMSIWFGIDTGSLEPPFKNNFMNFVVLAKCKQGQKHKLILVNASSNCTAAGANIRLSTC